MKTGGFLFVLAAAAVTTAGCERLDWSDRSLPPRSEVYNPERLPDRELDGAAFGPGDTALMVCGVSCPGDYDWRRDSAIGISSSCRLILFRNMEAILSLKTGYAEKISTDPDSHHLIGGHLYTEFSDADSTFIKRDGIRRASFKGREFLIGLVETGGALHTLSRDRNGTSVSYRIEGNRILHLKNAEVFGSFEDFSFSRTGALDCCDGSVYFSYRSSFGGKESIHVVRDGVDSQMDSGLFPSDIDDIKPFRKEIWAVGPVGGRSNTYGLYTSSGVYETFRFNIILKNRKILRDIDNCPFVYSERFKENGDPVDCVVYCFGWIADYWPYGNYHIFWKSGKGYAVPVEEDNRYLFSRGCTDYCNGVVYRAITPAGKSWKPYVMKGSVKDEIELDGYLTGVEVYVSPPS